MGSDVAAARGSVHATARPPCRRSTATCASSRPSSRRRVWSPTSAGSPTPARRSSPTRTCTPSTSPAPASSSRTTGTCGSSRACATRSSSTCGPELAQRIEGTTDSEWIYALVLSQLDDPYGLPETRELADATAGALRILRNVRAAHGIDTSSPVNLCVSTGRAVVATRFSFDYGWYPPEDEMLETDLPFVSLWYAIGGEYAERDGELADDGRRSAPLGDHRLRAAHDRLLDLARGAGVLDADRRAHARTGSSSRRATWMSDRETVDFLATVPLLEGREEADLVELARVMRRRTVREGEILWRQGDDAREMVFIVDGAVSASLHVPGDRTVEIGRAGPGEMVGEIGLLDGEGHTMSVRVTETATVLALGRLDFAALLAGQRSVGVQAEAPPRVALHRTPSQPAPAPRRLARRRGGRPAGRRMPHGRSPTWRTAARPTASTCVAWRPSTTSIRWRSGAS